MNDDSPTPHRHAADLASELAALDALGVLDGDDAAAMAACRDCCFGKAALAALAFEEVTAAITATAYPPVSPSAGLKDKILARIQPPAAAAVNTPPATTQEEATTLLITDDQGDWKTLPGGKIRIKTLSDLPESGHAMLLIEAQPGATIAPHYHAGMEEFYLISGDIQTNGHTLGPGDYLRHAADTHHGVATSQYGCRALLVTARENHPRKSIGVLHEVRNLLKTLSKR